MARITRMVKVLIRMATVAALATMMALAPVFADGGAAVADGVSVEAQTDGMVWAG
jgi:hypothetical protein